jgi:hypothetical protein
MDSLTTSITIPFIACSPMMVAGPTNSGKTQWVKKLLMNGMFTEPIESVLYCYGVYQEIYAELVSELGKKGCPVHLNEGLPSVDMLKEKADGKFHVIILDDLMEYIINDNFAQAMFTKYCHHFHMTTIFITQNIFAQGRCARTIALNTHILVLFANRRDASQIRTLARQQCPTNAKACIEAYEEAVAKPYGYFIIDCSPGGEKLFRWRTNIFPDEKPTLCYIIKGE